MLYKYQVLAPKIAILIPTKNGGTNIASTVASAAGQGNIYVINDGSTDDTAAVATAAGAFLVDMPENVGKAFAIRTTLNQHFDHLGGRRMSEHYDYIMVLDDDMLLTPTFTQRCLEVMARDGVVAVEGHCDVHWPQNKMWNIYLGTRAITYWRNQRVIQRVQSWFGIRTWLNGACVLYKADVLDAVVRPEPYFVTEDTDWRWQIHRRKMGKVKYAPKSQCDQQQPITFKATYQQQLRWAWGNFQLVMEHGIGRKASLLDFAFIIMLFDLIFSIFWPILAIQGAHKLHVSIFTLLMIGFGYYAVIGVITAFTLQRWRLLLMWPFAPFADLSWKVVTIHGFFKALKHPRIDNVTWVSPERIKFSHAQVAGDLERHPIPVVKPQTERDAPKRPVAGNANTTRVVIAVSTLASIVLASIGLGGKPLWLDEAFSFWFPRQAVSTFIDISRTRELNMVAHYFVMGTWGRIFDSPFGLRFFSVICLAIGTVLIATLAKELYGAPAVIPACVAWILNAATYRFGQEARGYMMATVAVMGAALCLLKFVKFNRNRHMFGFAMLGALGVYSHMFALLAMSGLCLAALWYAWPRSTRNATVRCITMFGLLCVPLLAFLAQAKTSQIGWISGQHRTLTDVTQFIAGGRFERLVIVVACLVTATAVAWSARRHRRYEAFRYALPVFWVVATVAGAYVVSLKQAVIFDRYFIVAAPGAVLIVAGQIGRAAVRRDGKILATLATLVVGLLAIQPMIDSRGQGRHDEWSKITAMISTNATPADQLVVLPGFQRNPFDYAWRRAALPDSLLKPTVPTTPIGTMSFDGSTGGEIPSGNAVHNRVFVVVSIPEVPDWEAQLAKLAPLKITTEKRFGNLLVREYSPTP